MAEAQQSQQLQDMEAEAANSARTISQRSEVSRPRNYMMKWLRIALYTVIAFSGSATAVLLTRLYYEKGGRSKWVGTVIQVVGFPIVLPLYYCISQPKLVTTPNSTVINPKPPSLQILLLVYIYLGLLAAGNGFLYSVGFQYLPASTITLISASQLAFNAFFSYFLNSQKFTPFILNSLVLLTISPVLLVANSNSEKPAGVSKREYAVGFICTFFAAAMNGLSLASQQLAFRKVLKRPTIKVVLDLIIYQSLVASILILIGFFAAGDWKGLKKEMEGYELGKASYAMTLLWATIAYQLLAFGSVALVFEVSALFCNVIGGLGLPIVPIIAMFVFHDKMDGVKGMAIVLAVWGFISYVYQNYLDDCKSNAETKIDTTTTTQLSQASSI